MEEVHVAPVKASAASFVRRASVPASVLSGYVTSPAANLLVVTRLRLNFQPLNCPFRVALAPDTEAEDTEQSDLPQGTAWAVQLCSASANAMLAHHQRVCVA